MEKRAVLLAVELIGFEVDDFRRRVLLVDKGALEREIDKAGEILSAQDRHLPHQQLARARPAAAARARPAPLVGLVDLVDEQEARDVLVFQLAQDQLQLRDFLFIELRRPRSRHRPRAAPRACRG